MEQGQCWMWAKRKYPVTSNLTSPTKHSYDDSWEEQAFAEDAAGPLGGCIWPPRSYSCSFCRREFRSAQALGGHMNVHRRDRARLKQPSSPQNEILNHDLEGHRHNPVQNPFTSLGYLYPSSVCGLAYNSKANSDPAVLASPANSSPSPSEALAPSKNENCREETLIPLYNSSIFQGRHKTNSPVYSSKSWSNLAEDRLYSRKFGPEADVEKILKGKGDLDKTDVAVSLNLVVSRAHPHLQFETKDISCKRRKTDDSSIPFFPKSRSVDHRHRTQSQMFEFSPSSMEELDLELRLGLRPKV